MALKKGLNLNNKGVSMIEVAISMALLLLIATPLLHSHLTIRHTVQMSRMQLEASELAKSYMETEIAQGYAQVSSQSYSNVTISDNGTASTDDDRTGDVDIVVTDNGDNTKTVDITVDWEYRTMGQTTNQSVSLMTVIADFD